MSVRERTYLRADDRRAQILGVAKTVFARRGYRDANVADICKAARIARGTLYQYFDNKKSVLLAIVEDIQARIGAVLDARTRVGDLPALERAPLEMVVAFSKRRLREVLDAVFIDETTLRLILRDARGLDGAVDRAIAEIDERLLAAMEDDLRAGQRAGLLRRGDPRMIARYALGGIQHVILSALSADEPIDLDAVVDQLVEIELFGLLSEEVPRGKAR
jgi:TetR/AcrR family transcriptional regulator, fatty acid metabolism regulator protein